MGRFGILFLNRPVLYLSTLITIKGGLFMSNHITIFTDGSCRGNPGPGGYAAIVQNGREEKVITGGERHTTNNRMELAAVIAGLQTFDGCRNVKVITDSRYVVSILDDGRALANLDLVQQLRQLAGRHKVSVEWVAAHSDHDSTSSAEAMNERCDRLAKAEAERHAQPEAHGCQVANFKDYSSIQALNQAFGDRWLYIGRKNDYAGLEQSPLANPFKCEDFGGQRGVTLPHYRHWLWQRIQAGDEAFLKTLRSIDEQTVLICWCHPYPCHGDVVKAAAEWLRAQES
jgi:ribonuclease HI